MKRVGMERVGTEHVGTLRQVVGQEYGGVERQGNSSVSTTILESTTFPTNL